MIEQISIFDEQTEEERRLLERIMQFSDIEIFEE